MGQIGRILVINTQSIYKNNATGITMRSILSLLPKENILELYRYIPTNAVPYKFEFRSVQIPPQDMPLNYGIRKILKLDNYREKDTAAVVAYGNDIEYTVRDIAKIYIKSVAEDSPIFPDRKLIKIVDDFHPTHIYTMGASFFINKWVQFFADRYSIPVVLHFMDNWRETAYTQDLRLARIRARFTKELECIENNMSSGLVISESMKEAYSQKYHRQYMALMNIVKVRKIQTIASEKIRVVYAGGLHLGRNEILKLVANCVNQISSYELYIYTSEYDRRKYESAFCGLNVNFMEFVTHDQVDKIYENSDILVHVESFDEKLTEYTKYSMSTKIPEYMAAGKPIICFAPKNIAVSKYINKTKTGIPVCNESELICALNTLRDSSVRDEYGNRGIEVAKIYHSEDALKDKLEEVFKID